MKRKQPTNPKSDRKRPKDINQLAHFLVEQSTRQPDTPTDTEISRVMAELGRRGGKIGGRKRAQALTPEKRRDIALKAARSRWDKKA